MRFKKINRTRWHDAEGLSYTTLINDSDKMDAPSRNNALLALLLALKELKKPLGKSQKDRLFEVGEQLELDPDDWEFIGEGLMAIIAESPSLNREFQAALGRLDALSVTKSQLVPTEEELAEALAAASDLERRGGDEGYENFESEEIVKIARKVLKENNPTATAKKSRWLDRVMKLLG
ncbi:MAG: hypothetical protein F6J93_21115 [Oscillatoria sp. SIO1A7]|nr:hypothetical protein [Oscillatoria sp. SIO1A7]